jgi:hypothetical protein
VSSSFIILVTIAIILAIAFWCGRLTAKYAAERGRSQRAWFLVGALLFPLFPIPWMALACLPRK